MTALVVSRVNLTQNPRADPTGAGAWSSAISYGTAGAGTMTYATTAFPVPGADINTCRRKTWSTASTGGTGVGFMVRADSGYYTPVTAGAVYTISVYVRHSVTDRTYALRCRFFNNISTGSGTQVGSDAWGSNFVVPAGTGWTRLSNTFTVPAGAAGVQVNPETVTAEVWPVGATQDATGLLIEQVPSLGPYFDGNTVDTATNIYEWNGQPWFSNSRQLDLIDWWSGPATENPLYYRSGGVWLPVDTVGLPGAYGPAGPEGIRQSCGGCSFTGGQAALANSSMVDAANFAANSAYSVDPDPCLQIFNTSTLQARRAGQFVISAHIFLNGKGTTAGSSVTMAVTQAGRVDVSRSALPRGSDRGTVVSTVTLAVNDKVNFGLWVVVSSPPTKADLFVTAAMLP